MESNRIESNGMETNRLVTKCIEMRNKPLRVGHVNAMPRRFNCIWLDQSQTRPGIESCFTPLDSQLKIHFGGFFI